MASSCFIQTGLAFHAANWFSGFHVRLNRNITLVNKLNLSSSLASVCHKRCKFSSTSDKFLPLLPGYIHAAGNSRSSWVPSVVFDPSSQLGTQVTPTIVLSLECTLVPLIVLSLSEFMSSVHWLISLLFSVNSKAKLFEAKKKVKLLSRDHSDPFSCFAEKSFRAASGILLSNCCLSSSLPHVNESIDKINCTNGTWKAQFVMCIIRQSAFHKESEECLST